MKLGILLFGHLRTFEYSSQYFIENVAKKYNCDIFMHTWDEIDSATQSWNNKINCYKKLDEITLEKVKTIYKPKSIIVGHQDNQNDEVIESIDGFKKVSVNGMNYMFESMRKANELRKAYEQELGIKYDYLLVTRPDVAVYNFLDIPATIKEAQSLNIDIDNARFFAGLYGNSDTNVRLLCNRVNDILFFAKPEVVDRYISVNSCFNKHELDKTFLNVVSIYTRNEIKAGIQPIEVCFECVADWKDITFSMLEKINIDSNKKMDKNFISKKFLGKEKRGKHIIYYLAGFKIKIRTNEWRADIDKI